MAAGMELAVRASMRTFALLLCLFLLACIAPDDAQPGPIFVGAPGVPDELAPQPSPDAAPPPDAVPRHPCEPVAEAWCKMQRQCAPEAGVDLEACRVQTLDTCCEATLGCQLRPAPDKRDACIQDIQRQTCPGELEWPHSCEWAARSPLDELPDQ